MSAYLVASETVTPQPEDVAIAIGRIVESVERSPKSGERWVVKLNLTYPSYLPGVVNSPIFVEGLCRWAAWHNVRLVFIEGDGGNGAYSAQNAFDGNGITALANRYGMKCTSISEKPWAYRETVIENNVIRLPYSQFCLERQYDCFISAPLFKNHIFTTVSLGFKNLWGCIPDPYRMYYHHILNAGIVALYKEIRPDFSIFDGIWGLRGRGPIDGRPLAMNIILSGNNAAAAEVAATQIMGINLNAVEHLSIAGREGLLPSNKEVSWVSRHNNRFASDFVIRRTLLDRCSITLSKYPAVQRRVYHSAASKFIYKVVNLYRGRTPQAELTKAKLANTYDSIPFSK